MPLLDLLKSVLHNHYKLHGHMACWEALVKIRKWYDVLLSTLCTLQYRDPVQDVLARSNAAGTSSYAFVAQIEPLTERALPLIPLVWTAAHSNSPYAFRAFVAQIEPFRNTFPVPRESNRPT